MFKGPTGPQSGRTPRTQAEEIGTSKEGFVEGPAYDPKAGHPITKDFPQQQYKEQQMKPVVSQPINIPAPFTLTQK